MVTLSLRKSIESRSPIPGRPVNSQDVGILHVSIIEFVRQQAEVQTRLKEASLSSYLMAAKYVETSRRQIPTIPLLSWCYH